MSKDTSRKSKMNFDCGIIIASQSNTKRTGATDGHQNDREQEEERIDALRITIKKTPRVNDGM